jgi:hypothetical protein
MEVFAAIPVPLLVPVIAYLRLLYMVSQHYASLTLRQLNGPLGGTL